MGDSVWIMAKKLGLARKFKEKMALSLWAEIVGKEIAIHTQAEIIRNGVMTVTADNPTWSQQLSLLRTNYIDQINQRLGEKIVKEIRFKTGSISFQDSEPIEKEIVLPQLSVFEEKKIREQIGIIEDSKLGYSYERFLKFVKRLEKRRDEEGWIKCRGCGKQIPAAEELCSTCGKKEIKTREIKVEQILYEIPWISYEQISKLVSGLRKKEFEKIKASLIMKLKEEIGKKLKTKDSQEQVRFMASFLIMLINEENPSAVTDDKIERILKRNYSKIV